MVPEAASVMAWYGSGQREAREMSVRTFMNDAFTKVCLRDRRIEVTGETDLGRRRSRTFTSSGSTWRTRCNRAWRLSRRCACRFCLVPLTQRRSKPPQFGSRSMSSSATVRDVPL